METPGTYTTGRTYGTFATEPFTLKIQAPELLTEHTSPPETFSLILKTRTKLGLLFRLLRNWRLWRMGISTKNLTNNTIDIIVCRSPRVYFTDTQVCFHVMGLQQPSELKVADIYQLYVDGVLLVHNGVCV